MYPLRLETGGGGLIKQYISGLCRTTALFQGRRELNELSLSAHFQQSAASNRCPHLAPLTPPDPEEPGTSPPSPAARPQKPRLSELPPSQTPPGGTRGRGSLPLPSWAAFSAGCRRPRPCRCRRPGAAPRRSCWRPALRDRRRRAMGTSRRRGRHPRGGAGTATEGGGGGKGRDEEGGKGGRQGAALPGGLREKGGGRPRGQAAARREGRDPL